MILGSNDNNLYISDGLNNNLYISDGLKFLHNRFAEVAALECLNNG